MLAQPSVILKWCVLSFTAVPLDNLWARLQYLDERGGALMECTSASSPFRQCRKSFASMATQPLETGPLRALFWRFASHGHALHRMVRNQLISMDCQVYRSPKGKFSIVDVLNNGFVGAGTASVRAVSVRRSGCAWFRPVRAAFVPMPFQVFAQSPNLLALTPPIRVHKVWWRFLSYEHWPLRLVQLVNPRVSEEDQRRAARAFWDACEFCTSTTFCHKVKANFADFDRFFQDRKCVDNASSRRRSLPLPPCQRVPQQVTYWQMRWGVHLACVMSTS